MKLSYTTPTPHIDARRGDFGNTVLMPGDPLRSKYIAENFRVNSKLINNVHGVQGYTGEWKGARVSVTASGMGIPAIALYSHELCCHFGVVTILRVGTAGAIRQDVHTRDLVLGMGCCTDSSYAEMFATGGHLAPIADYTALSIAASLAQRLDVTCHVGNLLTTDRYYLDGDDEPQKTYSRWAQMGVLAVEMEGAGLYMNAARHGRRALTICTVSNHILTGEELPVMERQQGLDTMITLALDTAAELERLPRLDQNNN
jgi:purine-nucleoside phosphorylase